MRAESDLRKLYAEVLEPRIAHLEADRRRVKRLRTAAILLVGIPGFCIGFLDGIAWWLGTLALLPMAAGVVAGVLFFVAQLGARFRFKDQVVAEVFRIVCPGGTYEPGAGLARAELKASGLFTHSFNSYQSDDLIRGRLGDVAFVASDVHAYDEERDGDGLTRRQHLFQGLFLRLDFNKRLRSRTLVHDESLPDRLRGRATGVHPVALEDPDFERTFAVRASDPVEARYVLTPLIMQRLSALRATVGRPIHAAFAGEHVYLAIDHGRALLESSLSEPLSFDVVRQIAEDFEVVEEVVRQLDLQTRIWSKEAPAQVEEPPAIDRAPLGALTDLLPAAQRLLAGLGFPVRRR